VRAAIVIFPGTNRERDMQKALTLAGFATDFVWHDDSELPPKIDLVALPGGFAHGDYLRPGAMAARSRLMKDIVKKANQGLSVFGVCNGFQVLTETGLLPGALRRNIHGRFICRNVNLQIEKNNAAICASLPHGQIMNVPVAHHDGRYDIEDAGLKILQDEGRIVFRYHGENPNGSVDHVAGIASANGRILGMMPHPEDHVTKRQGSTDGSPLFAAFGQMLGGLS